MPAAVKMGLYPGGKPVGVRAAVLGGPCPEPGWRQGRCRCMFTANVMGTLMVDSGRRSPAGIRTPDQRLRVFVSSTLDELAAEREAARAAVEQLQLAPVMFESGARPHPAQSVYRAYLEQSDVFVGIYWQRYGWVGPGMAISGLEDELRLAGDMPRLLYFKVPAPGMDGGLARMLDTIRSGGRLAYKTFTDAAELRALIVTDLATLLAERFGGPDRGVRWPAVPSPVTALVGRDADVAEVTRMLAWPGCSRQSRRRARQPTRPSPMRRSCAR